MRITDLFSRRSSARAEQALQEAELEKAEQKKKAAKLEQAEDGSDRVSISPLARHYVHLSSILADDEVARRDRIAALKKSVEDGTYSVDGNTLARTLVEYSRESEL